MTSSYYLGAAIDLSSDLNPFEIMANKIIEFDPKCVIFRPDKAYSNAYNAATTNALYLKNINDHALLCADIAIFYISSKVFSMGAALEIQERAKMHGGNMRFISKHARVERSDAHENEQSLGKKTIVITDKAGLYLKIQHSNDLYIHVTDKPLEQLSISSLIEDIYKTEEERRHGV